MKKKLLLITLCTGIVLSSVACGSTKSATSSKSTSSVSNTQASTSKVKKEVKKDLADGNYSDTGDGTFYVSTPAGTSENGNVPVMYVSKDDSLVQIGFTCSGINGNSLSYIYIDGMLSTKDQMSDSQDSIDLTGDSLSVGTHKVELVQYTNDSTDSAMTCYKSASYEIKEK